MNLYKTFSDEELFFSEIIPKLLHDLTLSPKKLIKLLLHSLVFLKIGTLVENRAKIGFFGVQKFLKTILSLHFKLALQEDLPCAADHRHLPHHRQQEQDLPSGVQ